MTKVLGLPESQDRRFARACETERSNRVLNEEGRLCSNGDERRVLE